MRTRWIAMLGALGCVLVCGGPSLGQALTPGDQSGPMPAPPLSPGLKAMLSASYLSEDEAKDARVFHGLGGPEDLDTPARRAMDALIRGDLSSTALSDPAAPIEDRAEAMLDRGELRLALEALAGRSSPRSIRIRAEALEGLGRFDEAEAAVLPLIDRLGRQQTHSALDLGESVRALLVRTRTAPQERGGGADFHTLMSLLAKSREELDRLSWPPVLTEAMLLRDKDNAREAAEAATSVLSLNPRCARAWALLGEMAVDGFDFERAERIAERLDTLVERGPSPLASLIRARARLRQRDPAAAEAAMAPTLDRYPRLRDALALRAAIAAQRFEYDRTDRLLGEFDELSPGSPTGYLAVGVTLSEARQYEQAGRYLAEAVARGPFMPRAAMELGLMQLQAGRDEQALEALERAHDLDPFNRRADNSLTLIKELLTYTTVQSEHFGVRFRPGIDEVLATEMLPVLESIYARVTGDAPGGIRYEPERRTLVELMPDHRWFSVRIAGMPRLHTMAASTGPVIAMESPREGPNHLVGRYDWPRVLQHEFTHTVTLSRTRNRIPHWFTEAAAVYMEDSPRDYGACRLLASALREKTMFDLNAINIAFVRPKKPTDRSLAYAQGEWMYEFIIDRWGTDAPLDLMDHYAQGQDQSSAMRQVLGVEPGEFLDRFKAWARPQAQGWGLLLPADVPDVRTLLAREAGIEGDPERVDPRRLPKPTMEMVDRWLEAHPGHPGVLELKIRLELVQRGGEPDASMIPLLGSYAKARPVDPLPHQLLVKVYLDAERAGRRIAGDEQIVQHLEFLDAREQHSAAYAVELAQRYAALGDWQRASAKAERATRIAPFDAGDRELAARVAIKRGDLPTARRHIEALTKIEPDRPIHTRRLERIEQMMGG